MRPSILITFQELRALRKGVDRPLDRAKDATTVLPLLMMMMMSASSRLLHEARDEEAVIEEDQARKTPFRGYYASDEVLFVTLMILRQYSNI